MVTRVRIFLILSEDFSFLNSIQSALAMSEGPPFLLFHVTSFLTHIFNLHIIRGYEKYFGCAAVSLGSVRGKDRKVQKARQPHHTPTLTSM